MSKNPTAILKKNLAKPADSLNGQNLTKKPNPILCSQPQGSILYFIACMFL